MKEKDGGEREGGGAITTIPNNWRILHTLHYFIALV